ncbi:MAG: ricin-type beta-trefoil lectin domain protein, partial [Archangium sp.]
RELGDLHDIRAGMSVRTVYLTAGDAGHDEKYWRQREAGIRAAYAQMARVRDAWFSSSELLQGKRLHVLALRDASRVSVVFLRLPDGHLRGGGYPSTGRVSLEKLWKGEAASLASMDGQNQYSRTELIDVLAGLMTSADADCIGTLDSSEMYGEDHSDHRHSAKFAFEAHRAYPRPHLFSQYRGYNIRGEPVNLSTESHDLKWEVFSTYARHDAHLCRFGGTDCLPRSPYASWVWRQYAATALQDLEGPITGLAGKCLDTNEGGPANGSPVQLQDCLDAPRQRWTLLYTGQLRAPSGRCLEVSEGNPTSGTPVQLGDCADVPRQKWTLLDNGQLRGPAGRCLEVSEGNPTSDTPVQLGDCADVPWQVWTPRFGPATPWASGAPFPEASLARAPGSAEDFRLADVNGDGYADACVRLPEGLFCALNTGSGSFGAFRRYLSDFTADGTPLQFADLNHDGKADVCELGPEGPRCAIADASGTAFVEARAWSSGFPGAAGSGDGSFLLADLDGDGYADACGRSEEGIRCALNDTSGHFAPSTVWLGPEGAEALGGPWLSSSGS